MKSYVTVTGILFAILTVVHAWRAVEEGAHVTRDPFFMGITLLTAAFSVWSWRVYKRLSR